MRYLFFLISIGVAFANEVDITFTVQAGAQDCFYQTVTANHVIDIEYQVIDASHGELDISFQLADPVGLVLITDYKKSENSHRHTAIHTGDYRLCFDNSFSTFSKKTVFLDLLLESEDNEFKDYDEDKEMELGNSAETYMMRVRDISESISRVGDNVSSARRLQELHSAHEARDRNLAEDMCTRVMTWSCGTIIVMLIIGVIQVVFVRSLFEDKNSRGGIRKYMPLFNQ